MKLTLLTLLVAAAELMQTPLKASKPLDKAQVLAFAARGASYQGVAMLVAQPGIGFEPTDDFLGTLQGVEAQPPPIAGPLAPQSRQS